MSYRSGLRYWERFLLPQEDLVHSFGVSRFYVFVFWGLPGLVLLGLVVFLVPISAVLASMLAIVLISVLIPGLYLLLFVRYAISNRRVMTREGFFHKRFVTADLPSVTDITIHESFLERLLTRTGHIGVNTAGSNRIELHFRHVNKPVARRQDIYNHQRQARKAINGEGTK